MCLCRLKNTSPWWPHLIGARQRDTYSSHNVLMNEDVLVRGTFAGTVYMLVNVPARVSGVKGQTNTTSCLINSSQCHLHITQGESQFESRSPPRWPNKTNSKDILIKVCQIDNYLEVVFSSPPLSQTHDKACSCYQVFSAWDKSGHFPHIVSRTWSWQNHSGRPLFLRVVLAFYCATRQNDKFTRSIVISSFRLGSLRNVIALRKIRLSHSSNTFVCKRAGHTIINISQ